MEGVKRSELMHVRKKRLEIEVTKKFSKIFKSSEWLTSNSSSYRNFRENGRFLKLLSTGRKRNYNQMIEVDKEERKNYEEMDKLVKSKQDIIDGLKSKVEQFEDEQIRLLGDQSKLAKLYKMGLIDNQGDPILIKPPEDPYDMK